MQLEIKIVIDFGDNLSPSHMKDVEHFVNERLQENVLKPACGMYVGTATTGTGWTSSGDDEDEEEDTYEVVKFFKDESKEAEVLESGLPLDEAKALCIGPETSGNGWFLGFRRE